MSTPTTETLNGGSTMVPTQTSDANQKDKAIDIVKATTPRPTGGNTTSGMTVTQGQQIPVVVKPVDRKTITGSTPGDFRVSGDYAKGSVEAIKNAGGPRSQMGQQASSKFDTNAVPFSSSTAGSEGDRA